MNRFQEAAGNFRSAKRWVACQSFADYEGQDWSWVSPTAKCSFHNRAIQPVQLPLRRGGPSGFYLDAGDPAWVPKQQVCLAVPKPVFVLKFEPLARNGLWQRCRNGA